MKIAVAGATGEVGRMMTVVLQEHDIKPEEISFFASSRSAGEDVWFYDSTHRVEELTEESMKRGFDYVLFSAGSGVSREFAHLAADNGSVVIDNSSAFRMDPEIPLVVPEINGDLLSGYQGIVANPNCSTIQMVLSLHKVHEKFGIRKIVVSTYQAVSGAGHKGITELLDQESGELHNNVFSRQIHRNLIPQIGAFLENGFSEEEMKMVNETHKIFDDYNISVFPTTVRVPVEYGHSESIYAETVSPFTPESLAEVLKESENVIFSDDFVTPLEAAGTDSTFVSRFRCVDSKNLLMWNVADNIRVGAATNAVRILKKHMSLNKIS